MCLIAIQGLTAGAFIEIRTPAIISTEVNFCLLTFTDWKMD